MNKDAKNKPSKKKPAAAAGTPPVNQTTQMSLIVDDDEFPTLAAASSVPTKSKAIPAKKPNQEPPLSSLMQSKSS